MRRLGLRVLLVGLLLAAAVPLQKHCDRERVRATRGAELTPDTFAATVLLAGFRAVAVNIAWMKVDYFERNGDLWAVTPTLRVITTLQPDLEGIWAYAGWHLAFNMSRLEPDEAVEDRWRWVRQGIDILREGLARNPGSWRLREQLGSAVIWLKCVDPDNDEAHEFFARRYQETYGRRPIDDVIQLLLEAQRDPEHRITVDITLARALFRAYEDAWVAPRGDPARQALPGLYARYRAVREHLASEHGYTPEDLEDRYPLPPPPE